MKAAADTHYETRWLEPRLGAEAAVRKLRLRRLGRAKIAPRNLELVWAPYRLITAPVTRAASRAASSRAASSGAATSRADDPGTPRVACLVCCLSGEAARIRLEDQRFLDHEPEHAALLAERLSEEAALEAGRGFGPAPLPEAARGEAVWRYPYWIATIERRQQRLDLQVLDAASGQRTGAATRRSILQALLDEHRRAASPQSRTMASESRGPEDGAGGIPFG